MFWKRIAIASMAVLAVATFAYAKNEFLSVDENDLGFEKKYVPAKHLIDPKPGHAYAYDIANKTFMETRLCEKTGLDIVDRAPPKVFRVINEVGVSYNAALEALNGKIPLLKIDFLREDQAEKTFLMTPRINVALKTQFNAACLDEIQDRLTAGGSLIFIVDAVYLDMNADQPNHMVHFDPRPLKPDPCEGECLRLSKLDQLLRPEWTAVVKERFVVVK